MASYTKLRDGSWGVRAGGAVRAGESLTVTKRDGTTKIETVGRVLWSGPDSRTGEVISLCTVLADAAPASPRAAYASNYQASRRSRCPNPRDCGDPSCDGDCGY